MGFFVFFFLYVFFFFFRIALITAFQLKYCCIHVASVGLLSPGLVITSAGLFFKIKRKGNESFCFLGSLNVPSGTLGKTQRDANFDICDHF